MAQKKRRLPAKRKSEPSGPGRKAGRFKGATARQPKVEESGPSPTGGEELALPVGQQFRVAGVPQHAEGMRWEHHHGFVDLGPRVNPQVEHVDP